LAEVLSELITSLLLVLMEEIPISSGALLNFYWRKGALVVFERLVALVEARGRI
jgi:hypothetical protein